MTLNSFKRPLLDDQQLYFMHIPKTAGLSLIALLDQHFIHDEICPVHEGYKKFLEYSPEQRGNFKFIRGHFPYKLAHELPRMPRMITFLREPISRTLSAISQHRRNEQQGVSYFKETIGEIDIEQFLDHPSFGVTVPNVAVKYLNDILGRPSQEKKNMSLSLAKERLETFDVIGFLEQFDESLALLADTFGFPPILNFPRINVDPSRSRSSEVKQSVLDRVAELNREEIELYEYGKKLFAERLKQMEKGDASPVTAPPAASIRFDFHRVDPGRGWYPAERHPQFGVVRWSGPQTDSRLRFLLASNRPHKIRFCVVKAVARDVLLSLSLSVGEQNIPLAGHSSKGGASIFEGIIPAEASVDGAMTEFVFSVNRTVHLSAIRTLRMRVVDFFRRVFFRVFRPRINTIYILDEQEYREGGLLYNWLEISPTS